MISFPLNPVLNQIYTFGTKSWIWVGNRWSIINISGGNRISVSNNVISADFTGYATEANVAQSLTAYTTNAYITSNYASIAYVQTQIANVGIGNVNLSGYATADFVTNSIANINLSGYASANFVTNAITALHIENYATNAYTTAYIQHLVEINMAPILRFSVLDLGSLASQSNAYVDAGTIASPTAILYDFGKI
jgi:hypothetical protein